jgi:hypothetical protein
VIPASRQRNYLQAALYVAIAGVIAAVLLDKLLTYAEAAEKATMEATVSRLSNALYARLAYMALRGEYEAIDAMPGESPFQIAHATSPAYLGEFDGAPPDADGGKWYFDRVRKELVYLPNIRRHLVSADDELAPDSIRFRLEVHKASRYAYTGVALVPTGKWRWEPQP